MKILQATELYVLGIKLYGVYLWNFGKGCVMFLHDS